MKIIVRIILLLFLLILTGSGCQQSTDPIDLARSGRITINSRVVNYQSNGFSFSQARVITFPNPEQFLPDVMVSVHTDDSGTIQGVFLSPPDFPRPAFLLVGQFSRLDSAENFFRRLSQLPDTTFSDLALPVTAGQIWGVETIDRKYAKILIRQTIAYADSIVSHTPTLYGETTFDWEYQPDGSRQF